MSASVGVEVAGRRVLGAREDPCLHAPEPGAVVQQRSQQAAAYSVGARWRSVANSDLG